MPTKPKAARSSAATKGTAKAKATTRKAKAKTTTKGKAKATTPATKTKAATTAKAATKKATAPATTTKAAPTAAPKKATTPASPARPRKPTGAAAATPASSPAAVTHTHAHAPPPVIGIASPAAARHRLLVDGERFGDATLSLRPLAPLRLTSGSIVTCDPFEVTGPPLGRRMRPGTHDVVAAVATYPGKHGPGEQLLAAVTVRFSDTAPVAWEPAWFADARDAADPSYPTSSGAGCFMDARVQAALAEERPTFPTASYRALERQLLDEHHVPTWGWATYAPEASAPATCVAFLGGATDSRRSYWGLDERGGIVCLLTDLEIFPADAWQA